MKFMDTIKQDYYKYKSKELTIARFIISLFDTISETRTLSYVITMRICSYLDKHNHGLLLFPFKYRLRHLQLKYGIEISYKTEIGAGFQILHGNGIVIHPNAKVGIDCTILQQVTIGNNPLKSKNIVASLGDHVYLGGGAKIIGPINIGNNVIVGANAVVVKDVKDNCIVAGIPARIINEYKR